MLIGPANPFHAEQEHTMMHKARATSMVVGIDCSKDSGDGCRRGRRANDRPRLTTARCPHHPHRGSVDDRSGKFRSGNGVCRDDFARCSIGGRSITQLAVTGSTDVSQLRQRIGSLGHLVLAHPECSVLVVRHRAMNSLAAQRDTTSSSVPGETRRPARPLRRPALVRAATSTTVNPRRPHRQ